jgi:heme/copper-type cytochrome/quinol oxidase subunit 3
MSLPLYNTILLVSSGIFAVFVHKCIMNKDARNEVTIGLAITIMLGCLFTLCQLYEYCTASFSIHDGIFGSIFYVTTGFHGLHVIIGTIALIVCLIRHLRHHFQRDHHIGLELTMWY